MACDIQFRSIGGCDNILNTFHSLTHVSNTINPIKLNETISTPRLNDFIEHVFLMFPDKYNEFQHPDYPLNYIKSITVEITSEISNQTWNVVYHPFANHLSLNEDYKTLNYNSIDDSILIPQNSLKDETQNSYNCSFFQKQNVIICPLKITRASLNVSIQWHEKSLPNNNKENTDSLFNNIFKYTCSLISNPVQLKPTPNVYIGRTVLNINYHVPDNLHVPKHESLDLFSSDLISYERKKWSEYSELKRYDEKQVNQESYLYVLKKEIGSSYLFFIHKKDLSNIKYIDFVINGNRVSRIPGLWLQTRYDEYKENNNNNNKTQFSQDDDYILLPLPPIYSTNIQFVDPNFDIIVHDPLLNPPNLFSKSKNDIDNDFVPQNRCASGILQLHHQEINYDNNEKSKIKFNINHLLCGIWSVVTYKGKVCSTSSPHPFSKLKSLAEKVTLSEGNGDYYNKIVPLYFEQSPFKKYLGYQIMFQNTPLSFSYPVRKNPYEPAHFISNNFYYSTLNTSRLFDGIEIEIFWDKEVIHQHYPETDQLKIHFFTESYNLLRSDNGSSVLWFV